MPVMILKQYLDEHRVEYQSTFHPTAYTAQEVAHAAHIPGKQLAKTVMVKLDEAELIMAVLPASDHVQLEQLAEVTGHRAARLASEQEFASLFPGCEVGGMPPFGNLWDIPVYVSESLAEDEIISFRAGSHGEIISLKFSDFRRLAQPKIMPFSRHD